MSALDRPVWEIPKRWWIGGGGAGEQVKGDLFLSYFFLCEGSIRKRTREHSRHSRPFSIPRRKELLVTFLTFVTTIFTLSMVFAEKFLTTGSGKIDRLFSF